MISKAKFLIKGEQHPEFAPENWPDMQLVAKFKGGSLQPTLEDSTGLASTSIVLVGEGAKRVFKHLDGGINLTTGGAFEALPIDFVFEEEDAELKLSYYIDFRQNHLIHRDDRGARFEGQIVKRKSIDWLFENADAFSFSYLFDIGEITDNLIKEIEYLVEKKIEGEKIFFIALTFYFIAESLKQIIYEINAILAKIGGVFTVIEAILLIFQTLLKHILTVIAIIALIKDIFKYILLGVRSHNGMYSLDMANVACRHIGLEFKSSILQGPYSKMFHLPSKSDKGFLISDKNNHGYPNGNSPIYNFGGYLRTMMTMFNAQIRIDNDVLRLERRDFWRSMTSYTLPDTRLGPYSLNTGALYSNYILRFVKDSSDLNTLENTDGINYQSTTEPKVSVEKDLNLLVGLWEGTIPLAQGYRKDELSDLEGIFNFITKPIISVVNAMLSVVNEIRKAFNKIQKFFKKLKKVLKFIGVKIKPGKGDDPGNPKKLEINTIENKRKGVLKLSAHTFAMDKVVLMENKKVTKDSKVKLSAEHLYLNYHQINEFSPKNNNQGKIYQGIDTVFCLKDFVTLLDFNGFKTFDGKDGDMLEIKWKFKSNHASLDFILYETYTNNFRNVTPPKKLTEKDEDLTLTRYHGEGFSDEFN